MDEEQRLKREVGEGGKEKKKREKEKRRKRKAGEKSGGRGKRERKSRAKQEGADPCELRLEVGMGSLPWVG